MPIRDFGKGLGNSFSGALEKIKEVTKEIESVNIGQDLQKVTETLKNKTEETGTKAAEQFEGIVQANERIKDSIADAFDKLKEATKDIESIDIGQELQKTAKNLKNKTEEIGTKTTEQLEEIVQHQRKVEKTVSSTFGKLKEAAQDIESIDFGQELQKTVKTLKDKTEEIGAKTAEQFKGIIRLEGKVEPVSKQMESAIPIKEALKIVYGLMAADGEVFHGEEEKFDSIGRELDFDFEQTKDSLVSECKTYLSTRTDQQSYDQALREIVDHTVARVPNPEDRLISTKLLIWDLLAVAYSDEHYDEAEQTFIEYTAEKLNIDHAFLFELQHSMLTLFDLEKELEWIKNTNRPYRVIDEQVKEIEKRKFVVFESAMALTKL